MFAPSVGCGHLDRCYAADFCLPLGIEKMAMWPIGWTPPNYYDYSQALALRRRDKGKPAVRRGAKPMGLLSSWEEVAGLSNGGGGDKAPPSEKGVYSNLYYLNRREYRHTPLCVLLCSAVDNERANSPRGGGAKLRTSRNGGSRATEGRLVSS
jgi:hypothetical protein